MKVWDQFIEKQRKELGPQIVDKWLIPLRLVRFDAGNLYLEARDHFQALWFEEHIRKKTETELLTGSQKPLKVHLSIAGQKTTKKPLRKAKNFTTDQEPPFKIEFERLDPYQTIENFIPTEANLVPYRLTQEILSFHSKEAAGQFSDKELLTFNPVYLWGYSGSGKTHLLQGMAAALRKAGINALYTRAETFTDHVVCAIRAGKMSEFRTLYRQAEVLLIDDVHVFGRKGATQEELFHTFNALHLAGKQIILSANCPPGELKHIEPRLVSRFEWGIVLPMSPLTGKDLKPFLQKKSEIYHFALNKKAEAYLLETFTRSPKTLSKALEALILRTHLRTEEGEPSDTITPAAIKHALADLISEEEQSAITPEKVLQAVAEHYGTTLDDLVGKSQRKESVLPRQVAMFICRNKLKLPYLKIGDMFSRDHSTVMSSIKKVEKEILSGRPEAQSALATITSKLQV